MARPPRIVIPGYPHHVTQRGSHREDVFFSDDDKAYYLDIFTFYIKKYAAQLLDYSLMDNHVHHLIVPNHKDDLAKIFKPLHMLYARDINERQEWSGHLW